jgi:hypothetical protein
VKSRKYGNPHLRLWAISGGPIEQLFRLGLAFEAPVLMRLIARDPRDVLHRIEDAFGRVAFLDQHRVDDLGRLVLREAAPAQKVASILVGPRDDRLSRRLYAADEG